MIVSLNVTIPDDAKPSEIAYALQCAMISACEVMRKEAPLQVDEMRELELPADLRATNAELFRSE